MVASVEVALEAAVRAAAEMAVAAKEAAALVVAAREGGELVLVVLVVEASVVGVPAGS